MLRIQRGGILLYRGSLLPMTVREARPGDADAIAKIYSQGIAGRMATFETEPRIGADILAWFDTGLPLIVVEREGDVVGFAAAFPYSDRCCYGGICEFSVYVATESKGQGVGMLAMRTLIDACRERGLHKLYSRVFPENLASLGLLQKLGFRQIGVYRAHGILNGTWRDVVGVEFVIEENVK